MSDELRLLILETEGDEKDARDRAPSIMSEAPVTSGHPTIVRRASATVAAALLCITCFVSAAGDSPSPRPTGDSARWEPVSPASERVAVSNEAERDFSGPGDGTIQCSSPGTTASRSPGSADAVAQWAHDARVCRCSTLRSPDRIESCLDTSTRR